MADVHNPLDDDGLQDLGLPVPVQTFLWRQIAPFIRPKLGKLHEASCMVRIINTFFSSIIHQYDESSTKYCSIFAEYT